MHLKTDGVNACRSIYLAPLLRCGEVQNRMQMILYSEVRIRSIRTMANRMRVAIPRLANTHLFVNIRSGHPM